MKKKVLVAMSGGVDSSTSAFILKEQGYDVSGVTFISSDFHSSGVVDAKAVCEKLGIEHITMDITSHFREKVVNYFVNEYSRGRTPNPCVMCNKTVKFGLVLDKALEMGFDYFSTGHYVKIVKNYGKCFIKRIKSVKDQSYYFYFLNQDRLKRIITPLADFCKDEVREIARKNNLFVWNKSESQDICFIKGDYKNFLAMHGVECKKGNFLDKNGNILGEHDGVYNYTVGQRRGLKISGKSRMYVSKIDYKSNSIILQENLKIKKLTLKDFNLSFLNELKYPIKSEIATRYNCKLVKGTVSQEDDKLLVEFDDYARFASPGQAAVFYINNILVGGGTINNVELSED